MPVSGGLYKLYILNPTVETAFYQLENEITEYMKEEIKARQQNTFFQNRLKHFHQIQYKPICKEGNAQKSYLSSRVDINGIN